MDKEIMLNQLNWATSLEGNLLSEEEQKVIVKFLLLFNVFEARLFKDGYGVSNLLEQISKDLKLQNWYDISKYNLYGKFFSDRYINDKNKCTGYFKNLKLKGTLNDKNSIKYKCKDALVKFKNYKENNNDYLLNSYLEIAYRFRNNLFHGNKSTIGLNIYKECFEKIIFLIENLLKDMILNNFDGLNNKY